MSLHCIGRTWNRKNRFIYRIIMHPNNVCFIKIYVFQSLSRMFVLNPVFLDLLLFTTPSGISEKSRGAPFSWLWSYTVITETQLNCLKDQTLPSIWFIKYKSQIVITNSNVPFCNLIQHKFENNVYNNDIKRLRFIPTQA